MLQRMGHACSGCSGVGGVGGRLPRAGGSVGSLWDTESPHRLSGPDAATEATGIILHQLRALLNFSSRTTIKHKYSLADVFTKVRTTMCRIRMVIRG